MMERLYEVIEQARSVGDMMLPMARSNVLNSSTMPSIAAVPEEIARIMLCSKSLSVR